MCCNACQAIAAKQAQQASQISPISQIKGQVRLCLQQQADMLCVTVEDDGVGISPELQKRILEPFFTTREVGSGVGMGLAVSYGIIQRHGGTLEIAGIPGKGSRFCLKLPLGHVAGVGALGKESI